MQVKNSLQKKTKLSKKELIYSIPKNSRLQIIEEEPPYIPIQDVSIKTSSSIKQAKF